jgi:aspartate racemase
VRTEQMPQLNHPHLGTDMRSNSMYMIGIIGGMSWESTAVYYRRLNEFVRDRMGGLHSARILLASLDFSPIAHMQKEARWNNAEELIINTALDLKRGGADLLILATNTMHKVADAIGVRTGLPFIDIRSVTARALKAAGKRRPLLLGTRFTMEDDFYTEYLRISGLDVLTPAEADRSAVHGIIFEELCRGIVSTASKARFLAVIDACRTNGMDSVIFGCTEIGLLLSPADVPEGAFDTTELHAAAAIERALAKSPADNEPGPLGLSPVQPDWPAGLGGPPERNGFNDAVSLWRLQNMTHDEREEFLGPPRRNRIFTEKNTL